MTQNKPALEDITGKWQSNPNYMQAAVDLVSDQFDRVPTMAMSLFSARVEKGVYIVVLAAENRRAFNPTSFILTEEHEAQHFVDQLNKSLGVCDREALRIADSSLGRRGRWLH